MRRGLLVALSLAIVTALLAVPSASARCPDPPKDCNSAITDIFEMHSAKGAAGIYVDDVLTASGDAGDDDILPIVHAETDSGATTSSSTTVSPGDHGGVVMRIDAIGTGVTSITFVFDDAPTGVKWDGPAEYTFTGDELYVDSFAVLPFTVTTDAQSVVSINIGTLVKDSAGDEKVGTLSASVLHVLGSPPDNKAPALGVVVTVTGLAAVAMLVRRRLV